MDEIIGLLFISLFIIMSLGGFRRCLKIIDNIFNYIIRHSTYCRNLELEIEKRNDIILDLRKDIYDIETRLLDSIYS